MAPDRDNLAVLLIDDEPNILFSSRTILRSAGIRSVETLDDSRRVMPLLNERGFGVIVLDLFMPHLSGQELLTRISRKYPHIPVLIMTAADELDRAVDCMKKGAHDYLVKPVDKARFITSVQRAMELRHLRDEVHLLKEQLLSDDREQPEAFAPITTCSKKMLALFRYMEVIACSRQPILFTGETGTGKELFARTIHALSGLSGNLTCVNVAGLDDNLFSDALFGHERGAFTGADRPRAGLIANAAGGTLFLDEFGDLGEASQVKLLRLLQEQEYYPIGSDVPRKSDARVVVATNRNLQQRMAEDRFRSDLYYRLCAHHVHIPPLRERPEDIPLLLNHFLDEAAQEFRKKKPASNPELPRLLGTYALSSGYYDAYYLKAQKVRTLIRQDFLEAFNKVDVMLTPVAPTPAFRLGEKTADPLQMYLSDIFTIPVNLAGTCGLSVPCGFSRNGLPIGLQLIGQPFGEETLLRAAHAYQQATDWHCRQASL